MFPFLNADPMLPSVPSPLALPSRGITDWIQSRVMNSEVRKEGGRAFVEMRPTRWDGTLAEGLDRPFLGYTRRTALAWSNPAGALRELVGAAH